MSVSNSPKGLIPSPKHTFYDHYLESRAFQPLTYCVFTLKYRSYRCVAVICRKSYDRYSYGDFTLKYRLCRFSTLLLIHICCVFTLKYCFYRCSKVVLRTTKQIYNSLERRGFGLFKFGFFLYTFFFGQWLWMWFPQNARLHTLHRRRTLLS